MGNKSIRGIFSVILFAGLAIFNPLNVLADSGNEAKDSEATQTLETNVKEALREHVYVEIEVTGEDVTLRGHVHTRNEKNIVESQIRGVPGVKYVRDEIVIGQSAIDAIEEKAEDTAITATVKAKILATRGLNSLDIHIKTEQGVVTLSGKVKKASEMKLAEKTVQGIKGVKKVVNALSVER